MTAPDELQRAVKALTDMRDAARDGTPVTDPNEWEFDELTRILAAFHFLLSERAELLAAVERMRGALGPFAALAEEFSVCGDGQPISIKAADGKSDLNVGHLRRAAEAAK